MKAIILAGGYAKRLWPLTKETPKPLLDIGNQPIISRIFDHLEKINRIDEYIISTNEKFGDKFKEYIDNSNYKKPIKLIVEPTLEEDKKLGSIGGLNYLIEQLKLDHNTLIIGGDNIFEFDMNKLMDFFNEKESSVVALKEIENKELIKNYGVCVLDENKKIIEFQEKPENPKSNYASTACYLLTKEHLALIKTYLDEGNSPDAMGFFITWLINKAKIYGFIFKEDWFDIGSLESLEEAKEIYKTK